MTAHSDSRKTTVICEAGEVIRELSPSRLATLCALKHEPQTQLEMASRLGCSSSLVSKHLGALQELPVSLVNKTDLATTSIGDEILGQLKGMFRRLGVELDDVDWADGDDVDTLKDSLSPLPAARGPLLYLIYHSIGVQKSAGSRIDLLQQKATQTGDIVTDVEDRQQDRGETVRRKQVRWQLKKLADAGCITFDNERVVLKEKGEAQLRFFEQVIRTLEREYDDKTSHSQSAIIDERSGHPSSGREGGVGISLDVDSETLSVVAEYHIGNEVITLDDGMTVGEFIDHAARLGEEFEKNTELQLELMLRSSSSEEIGLLTN